MDRPVQIAVIGYGNRAGKYLRYAEMHPEALRLRYAVEPNPLRLAAVRERFSLPASACFTRAEELFARPSEELDGVLVCSPDRAHYGQACQCIGKGWSVLLEKPAACSEEACEDLCRLSREKGVDVMLGFVLHYFPYYRRLKEWLLEAPAGPVRSVRHTIRVGIDRMTHSFVRGLWGKEELTSPLIVSKCSHDIDLLLWLLRAVPVSVRSTGGLDFFCAEQAPAGSAARCTACPLEASCRYSAVDLYCRRREWISNFDIPAGRTREEAIEAEVATGPFGRCVFRCDNDVVDHQEVHIDMEGGMELVLQVEGREDPAGRFTEFTCAQGRIEADGTVLRLFGPDGGLLREERFPELSSQPLHGGTDLALMEDFVRRLSGGPRPAVMLEDSRMSHRVCFAAEESRAAGGKPVHL